MAHRIIRISKVMERTGLSRSHIYRLQSKDQFPQSINLCGGRAVGWLAQEIDEWINSRIEESRKEGDRDE